MRRRYRRLSDIDIGRCRRGDGPAAAFQGIGAVLGVMPTKEATFDEVLSRRIQNAVICLDRRWSTSAAAHSAQRQGPESRNPEFAPAVDMAARAHPPGERVGRERCTVRGMKVVSGIGGWPEHAPEAAKRAEDDGFDVVSCGELAHDSVLTMALAATTTQRIEDCQTSVTIAFPRSPMVLAMEAWDIQQLSGGRVQPRARQSGQGPQRASIRGGVVGAGSEDARVHRHDAVDLGLLAKRLPAELCGPGVPLHADESELRSGSAGRAPA